MKMVSVSARMIPKTPEKSSSEYFNRETREAGTTDSFYSDSPRPSSIRQIIRGIVYS